MNEVARNCDNFGTFVEPSANYTRNKKCTSLKYWKPNSFICPSAQRAAVLGIIAFSPKIDACAKFQFSGKAEGSKNAASKTKKKVDITNTENDYRHNIEDINNHF